jgi:PIN domain nuclease of toxin-antitoxin system
MRATSDGPLLLDTHVVVWYAEGHPALKRAQVERLDRAATEHGLAVSALSARELAWLTQHGRLQLVPDVRTWISRLQRALRMEFMPVDAETAQESALLPGEPPRDPVDQLLCATARVHGLTLVTRDAQILEYARAGHIQVVAA